MHAPHLTKTDVVMTIISATLEATLAAWWVNRRWFCGREARRAK